MSVNKHQNNARIPAREVKEEIVEDIKQEIVDVGYANSMVINQHQNNAPIPTGEVKEEIVEGIKQEIVDVGYADAAAPVVAEAEHDPVVIQNRRRSSRLNGIARTTEFDLPEMDMKRQRRVEREMKKLRIDAKF